ncbi:acetate--CoA ligase family protein [Xanthobacter flavus]|jgi:acyl-CoA synthetase (NDP forming)|uniref:acetate--CoA ligase family protein n=1 Tax=Xanthobacter flavus TaxID=281 RepID=UPI0037299A40
MLDRFFNPSGIAVVGASDSPEKIGGKILRMLQRHGFSGGLYPVNPSRPSVGGLPAYASIDALPDPVDLALVAVPAPQVPEVLSDCATRGIPGAVVFSSGFSETGEDGRRLQQQIAEICASTGIRVSGPNAEGFYTVPTQVAATFSPGINIDALPPSDVQNCLGMVSQSGGLGFSLYSRGRRRNLAFSHIVSVGNQVDLECVDFLNYLLDQPQVKCVLMYVESLRDPQAFLRSAERAARMGKPIVMAKVGRSSAGQRAAQSHTGAIAGSVRVSDAVLDHYGVLRADDQEDMLDLATALAHQPTMRGNRVAIISTSGGSGVWLSDACEAHGFVVPPIDPERQQLLRIFIPSYGSTDNPVDITAQGADGYAQSLKVLGDADYIDAFIIAASFAHETRLNSEGEDIARAAKALGKPVLFYSYSLPSDGALNRLQELGLQCYTTITGCIRGLSALRRYELMRQDIPMRFAEPAAASKPELLDDLLETGGATLCEYEAKALLGAYGVEVPPQHLARSPSEAASVAGQLGFPVVLKIQSPDIPHKTEADGVRLGLESVAAVEEAFTSLISAAQSYAPDADVRGVLVQPMAERGVEMIAGTLQDRDFGPMVMVGMGGIYAEILDDVAIAPAPVSEATASRMIAQLKGLPILDGARGRDACDLDALARLLVALGRIAVDTRGEIQELDVNPVFLHPRGQGVTIVDALGVRRAG